MQRDRRSQLKIGILEAIIFNVLVFLIFFWFSPVRENFLSMNIHPLVIVCAVIAVRYGGYTAIVSVVISSFLYFFSYYYLGRDIYIFLHDIRYYKFIIIFYLVGAILGRMRDNFDTEILKYKTEYSVLKESYENLRELYEKNRFISQEMKKRIVGAKYSILSLYEIASSLESLDPERIYTETMGIFSEFLKVKTMSIYIVDEDLKYMRLKIRFGNIKSKSFSVKIEDCPICEYAIREREPVKWNTEMTGAKSLMSAPIIKDEKVMALINIEEMDFEMVSDYSFNLFKIITDWVSKALVQAVEVDETRERQNYYEDSKIMKKDAFERRVKEEEQRKIRFEMEYVILRYRFEDMDIFEAGKKMNRFLRNVDVMTIDEEKKEISILLPATRESSIPIIEERLAGRFEYRLERVK